MLYFLFDFKWILAGKSAAKWNFTQSSLTIGQKQCGRGGGEGVVGVCEQCVISPRAWERWCGGGGGGGGMFGLHVLNVV